MNNSIDRGRLKPGRTRREMLAALGAGAIMLGVGSRSALGQDDNVLTEALVLRDPDIPAAGNVDGDTTIVEYFDYNCPYCRKLAPSIHALVKNDQKVAVVFKEWPIFGGISVYAARSALASQWQGKYLTAHDALIGASRLSQAAEVDEALQNAGINLPELKKTLAAHGAQIDAILARNNAEAHSLGMRGTPGLLVGRDVSSGIGDLAGLQIAVAEARRTP